MKPIAYILAAAVIALGVFVLSMSGLKAATDPRSSIGPRVIGNAELLALENLNATMQTLVSKMNADIAVGQRIAAALEQANALKAQELSMEATRIDLETFQSCHRIRYQGRMERTEDARMAHWTGLDCATRTGLSLWAEGPQPASIP